MSTPSYALRDTVTMLGRNARHLKRYPIAVMMSVGIPVMLLLLFVGVFGSLGKNLAGGAEYIDYVVPGILLMTVGYGATSTAMAVNQDKTEGIMQRFRTMAITRSAVLTGHVLGAVIRTAISLVLVVAVAVLLGFRATGDPLRWLAAAGLLVLLALAITWSAVAVGLAAGSVEGITGFTLIVQVLPFLSSAFVPPEAMSSGVRWFADNVPFTPVINTLRGLLQDTPVGADGPVAVAWCVAVSVLGYLWARSAFARMPAR